MKRAIVTGASGFIGGALAQHLAASGVRVLCPLRVGSLMPGADTVSDYLQIYFLQKFSIEQMQVVFQDFKADVVYHLAASGVSPDDRDPMTLEEGTVGLTQKLLLALEGCPPQRFFYAGTCSEYGFVNPPVLLSEKHMIEPLSLYGAAKSAAAIYGFALAQQLNIPFINLRLFGVYGPGEGQQRLLPYLVRKLLNAQPVKLTGGEQVRDLLYIDDVVEAFVAAGQSKMIEKYRSYNVCSSSPVTVRQLVEYVCELLGSFRKYLIWNALPYRADESMWIVGDNQRFKSITSWSASIPLMDGLKRAVQFEINEWSDK
ncbi:MAG: NAD(P)-dependent oxidoreductase [Desulfobacula sp.]|nr:NAD(P)-dependent oxidoreductase [Desulfobacula sp.]